MFGYPRLMAGAPTPEQTLLDELRTHEAVARAAEIAKIQAAIEWAVAHEVMGLDDASFHAGFGEHGLTLAGPGAPLVGENAVTELAVALGLSTEGGRRLLGCALEVRYRLPRLWEAVCSGRCPWWRAKLVGEATMTLCEEGAEHVDVHVNGFTHAVSGAQLDRIVATALARWQPEEAEAKRRAAAEGRGVNIHLRERGGGDLSGTVDIDGTLDAADALDLETALADRAHELKLLGSTDTLPVRRAAALGDLARLQSTLTLSPAECVDDDGNTVRLPARRTFVLHVHVAQAAVTGVANGVGYDPAQHGVATFGNLRAPVTATQVRSWCHTAGKLTVRPVLDLAAHLHSGSYESSGDLREQTVLRDQTCVFPRCTRSATSCDHEHCVPWPQGTTCSANQAPMCRTHHRHKTHLGWSYETLTPGVYLWTSPHGLKTLRMPEGTFDVSDPPPTAPDPPPLEYSIAPPPPRRRPTSMNIPAPADPARPPDPPPDDTRPPF